MNRKLEFLLIMLIASSCLHAQSLSKDSLIKAESELRNEIVSLTKLLEGNSDFKLTTNERWVESKKTSKTYICNRLHSSTYIVLNNDSTFLYKHNGCGSNNKLHKGKWRLTADCTYVLETDAAMTLAFVKHMKKFEKNTYNRINYKAFKSEFQLKQDMLIDVTKYGDNL